MDFDAEDAGILICLHSRSCMVLSMRGQARSACHRKHSFQPFRSLHCLQRHIHVAAFRLLRGGGAGVVGHRSAAGCRILEAHEQADLGEEVGVNAVFYRLQTK